MYTSLIEDLYYQILTVQLKIYEEIKKNSTPLFIKNKFSYTQARNTYVEALFQKIRDTLPEKSEASLKSILQESQVELSISTVDQSDVNWERNGLDDIAPKFKVFNSVNLGISVVSTAFFPIAGLPLLLCLAGGFAGLYYAKETFTDIDTFFEETAKHFLKTLNDNDIFKNFLLNILLSYFRK